MIKNKLVGIWKWVCNKGNVALIANIATVLVLFYTIHSVHLLMHQTGLLKNQVFVSNSLSISQIGDRCMWNTPYGGDYDSYILLKRMEADPINKDMINAIRNQISRVEKKYKSTDVMVSYADKVIKAIWKYGVKDPTKEDVWAKIDTVDTNNIFDHMKKRYLESENIKAAYFMSGVTTERLKESGKTWEDVFETLIWAINNDTWCLYGRKMALITYCQLAEKEFPGVFDFEGATKDWQNRKREILEKKNKFPTNQFTEPDSSSSGEEVAKKQQEESDKLQEIGKKQSEKYEKLLQRMEKQLDRGDEQQKRYDKILSGWETQQEAYQQYLYKLNNK